MPFSEEFIAPIGPAKAARLAKAARRWSRLWRSPALFDEIAIRRNRRLTRTVARYNRVRKIIEIGNGFFGLRSQKAEVLCHELAHAGVGRMVVGTKAKTHGGEWMSLMRRVGYQPAPTIKLPARPAKDAPAGVRPPLRVYAHRCPICHSVWSARRPMRSWRCAFCVASGEEGKLVMERWK